MEKCLIFLSSITSQFRNFFHWIVFNLFFLLRDSENDLLAWPMRVSNEEVGRRANTEIVSELVRKRRWTWIGHVLRMDNSCLPRVALTWAPEGKRKRGRPKETWRRTVEKERIAMGFNSWVEAGMAAANRVSWRKTVKKGPLVQTVAK